MKTFLGDDFLLSSPTAEKLYHDYAKTMPIIDYHCHLSPQEIYENKTYKNITEIWLYGDHYKWRAMRANGVDERYITGDADDYDKFIKWSETLAISIGNPLYHWSHLELKRYFGIEESLNGESAPRIWEQVNAQLNSEGFGARDFIEKSNVEIVCTTDDPTDTLEYHIKLKEDTAFKTAVLPAFRPDNGLEINKAGFVEWVQKLEMAAGEKIENYSQFLAALEARVKFFHSVGCRVSDHGLGYVPFAVTTKDEAGHIFGKVLKGAKVSHEEEKKYKAHVLIFLGKLYASLNWTMQYHMNASRNNSQRMFEKLGADTGLDAIDDSLVAQPLAGLLNAMDYENQLPKTILYSVNPIHNHVLATLAGSFQDGKTPGKMQLGSGWWHNDTKLGMIAQMTTLADVGLLSRFVGMLTDSRSFLSYTRHEYFRRILCDIIGGWVDNGEYPNDMEQLGRIVQDICYNNAKAYFAFES